jgi:AcrR family transcriptional regulator
MTDAVKKHTPATKRSYDSPVRQAGAAETRSRIVDAAGRLFEARGYARTTIRQIADAAGVAVDTIYATFGSKPRVLTAVIDDRLAAGTGVANVMERPEALAVRDETDQRRQLRLLAQDLAATVARVGPVFEMMRTAASVEPAMAAVYAEMQGYRAANLRRAIDWVAARGPLRVEVERAADTLWVLAAPDVARLLCDGKGWSTDDYAAWLEDLLVRALLADR